MRALVTAEWTADGAAGLADLGYSVVRAGWGATGRTLGRDALVAEAAGADLLVVEVETVDEHVLAGLPDLRVVGTARGGPTNVDLAACTARGIPVLYAPARNAESVADFVLGLILTLARGITAAERHLRTSGWLVGGELPYLHFRGPELAGRTLGLVGYGAVGRAVARRACDGFGMRVLYTDPYVDGSVSLEELLAAADVVSLHCSRGPATAGLIGAAALARMKPTAYLVNTAGGDVVDEAALLAALADGGIAGAALDVHTIEPLPPGSPVLAAERLVLTPHLAGAADDVVGHHTRLLLGDLRRLAEGRQPEHCANPDVLCRG